MLITPFILMETVDAGPEPTLFADLKGQSHEKVGEMSLWGISLGPN
jgi:hypothetical protein